MIQFYEFHLMPWSYWKSCTGIQLLFYFEHVITYTRQLKAGMAWILSLTSWDIACFSVTSPPCWTFPGCHCYCHSSHSLPCPSCLRSDKCKRSRQQRLGDLICPGAHLPECGLRQISFTVVYIIFPCKAAVSTLCFSGCLSFWWHAFYHIDNGWQTLN